MSEENKEKSAQAAKIVRNHAIGAIAGGVLPVPLLDIAILGGVQLRMLQRLAKHYEVEFHEQRANAIIGSLVGIGSAMGAGTLLRLVPGVGKYLLGIGALTLPFASTYALGHVFLKHFESGGTFLNFDPERAKKDYEEKLEEGRREAEPSYVGVKP